jgi:hypothetical protein
VKADNDSAESKIPVKIFFISFPPCAYRVPAENTSRTHSLHFSIIESKAVLNKPAAPYVVLHFP